MASAAYGLGIQKTWAGSINFVSDDIKAVLVDLDDYGIAISGATNATPIVVTSATHGMSDGQRVYIAGVGGNTNANGVFRIANSTGTTFELTDVITGANIAGNGAYTSGGYLVPLDVDEFHSDIPAGAIVSTSGNLTGKTNTLGVLDAADFTFSSVTGDTSELIVYYKDTGVSGTSPLLFLTSWSEGSIIPNGGDINVTINANGIFRALG